MMDESLRFSDRMGISDDIVTKIRKTTAIIVTADDEIATTMEGQIMLEVTTNLLSRVFPHVLVEVSNLPAPYLKTSQLLKDHLVAVSSDAYQWDSSLVSNSVSSHIHIIIGNRHFETPAIYIDADGWLAYAGTVPSGLNNHSSTVPIGGVASACIGVSEVFKKLFKEHISVRTVPIEGQFWFNTLTYNEERINFPVSELALDRVALFGCGSIGSSLLYTLGFLPSVIGKIDLIDRDPRVDFKNLQRYSLLTVSDVIHFQGISKANWAAKKLRLKHPNLTSIVWDDEKGTVVDFLDSLPSAPGINLAISAVDNIESRIQIADCLAKRSINAGTSDTTLTITRHGFADGQACLACANVSQAPNISWFDEISKKLGIPIDRIAFLMQGKALLESTDLTIMKNTGSISENQLNDLLGTDLASFVNRHLYSAVNIKSCDDQRPVTAPFVSLFAGALLAGEMIKELSGITHVWSKNKYQTDMMALPELYTSSVAIAGKSCLCSNIFRRTKYKQIWANSY